MPSSIRVRPRLCVVALLLACTSPLLALPAFALPTPLGADGPGASVTFGVLPATGGKQDARGYFSFGVTPGATLVDSVALVNYSVKPARLDVKAADAFTAADGGFALQPTADVARDVGRWVTIAGRTTGIDVPGRSATGPGRVVLPIKVSVPDNASPGDHGAGILAILTSVSRNKQGVAVKLEQRVGTRIYVRVSGLLRPALVVEDLRASYVGTANPAGRGKAVVTYRLRNSGNVKLGGQPRVTVDGLASDQAVDAQRIPLLLPGGGAVQRVEVTGVWPQVRLTAQVRVQALELQSDVNPATAEAAGRTSFWAIPWTLLLVVVGLVLGLLGWLRYRRRRTAWRTGAEHARPSTPEVLPTAGVSS